MISMWHLFFVCLFVCLKDCTEVQVNASLYYRAFTVGGSLALTWVIMLRSHTKVIISSVKSAQSFPNQSPKKAVFAAYDHSHTWTGIVTADWHTLQIKK